MTSTDDSVDGQMISIIMAVHNAESTVESALESIYAQTYSNWELVICNDASTDDTVGVIDRYVASAPPARIRIIHNAENKRLAYSLNRCLEVATGPLIARMDADDMSEPDRLERQARFLRENPGVDLVGSTMRRFNDRGEGDIVMPASLIPDRWTLGKGMRVPFCHATILTRREVYDTVGNYTVSWRTERGQDLDLWYKFYEAGFVGRNIADPLYRVREDEAAIRRRTPRARFGAFVTRMRGNWALRYSPRAYFYAATDLAKVVVPYRFVGYLQNRRRRQTPAPGSSTS